MVSFGIIKGFLRRIQVFPIWLDHPSFRAAEQARGTKHVRNPRGRDKNVRPITTASSWKDADAGNWGGREELLGSHLPPEKDLSLHAPASRKERDTTPRPGAVTSALATQSHHRSDHAHDRERMDGRGYPSGLPGLLDGEHSTDEVSMLLLGYSRAELEGAVRLLMLKRQCYDLHLIALRPLPCVLPSASRLARKGRRCHGAPQRSAFRAPL